MKNGTPFADWLRQRRKLLDLTQQVLAEKAGCSAVTIRKLEAGDRRPSRELARAIAVPLCIPEREIDAFIRYARSTRFDPTFHLPLWEPETPSWRTPQLPDKSPNLTADVTALLLDYAVVANRKPVYYKLDNGSTLAKLWASGTISGDLEGTIEEHFTQVIHPKPAGIDISHALPMQIGVLFTITSGEDEMKGTYTATYTPAVDAAGNGTGHTLGSGRVISVSPRFHALLLHLVFVETRVKLVEGIGTGAHGQMRLESPAT